jgi:integrase
MAYARKLDSGKWLGVYRDPSGKKRYTAAMARKGDALRGAQEQERRVRTGHWTDPGGATVTVREWSERWLALQTVSPKTLANRRHVLESLVLPRWGKIELGKVTHLDVMHWVTNLRGARGQTLSPATVRKAAWVFSSMLALAVKDGRLTVNHAQGVKVPSRGGTSREHVFLSHRQLQRLADCAWPRHRTVILLLGLTGLRPGEALALQVGDFDMLRRRVSVRRADTSAVDGELILKETKTGGSRSVAFPRSLTEPLAEAMAGKGRSELVFSVRDGGPMHQVYVRNKIVKPAVHVAARAVELLQESLGVTPVDGVMGDSTVAALRAFQAHHGLPASGETDAATWDALAEQATGIGRRQTLRRLCPVTLRAGDRDFSGKFTTYDLRHTAASLAISAGANVKAVQSMLGHAKASMTLDVYAGLFGDDLDAVAERMDAGFSEAGGRTAAMAQEGGTA